MTSSTSDQDHDHDHDTKDASASASGEPKPKTRRGFAVMDPAYVREIAHRGGLAAHRKGTAHRFTAAEAREAGKKGGSAPHRSRGRPAPQEG